MGIILFRAENDLSRMDHTNKDLEEINSKVQTLYKEADVTRDNLAYETDEFMEYL